MAIKPRMRLVPADATAKPDRPRSVGRRWIPALAKTGFTPVVDVFLEQYTAMSPPLTTPEAMLVIQLMRHKWDEKPPFPAFKTLAKRMGISDTQARTHARNLEAKKYLRRIKRIGQPNLFGLTPLFTALEKKTAEVTAQREKRMSVSA